MELHAKSQQLLETLANSIHDRDSNFKNFCFSIVEVQVVEEWIREIAKELKKDTNQ